MLCSLKCNFVSLLLVSGCGFQAFREEVAPLRQDVRVVNELSAELTPLDIQLSSTASRQLDQLNMRWKLLQVLLSTVHTLSQFSLPLHFPSAMASKVRYDETPSPLFLLGLVRILARITTLFFLNSPFLRV